LEGEKVQKNPSFSVYAGERILLAEERGGQSMRVIEPPAQASSNIGIFCLTLTYPKYIQTPLRNTKITHYYTFTEHN